MTKSLISMRGLRKVYHSGLLEADALAGFDLEVAQGEFLAVMGPSGSGKTTFLNVAGLLDELDEGEYRLDGRSVAGLSDDERAAMRNQLIGFVFQSFNLLVGLDVYENVETPLRFRRLSARERRERVERVLVQVGLTARMHHLPSELSGGQQQRVAIARALVTSPRLILADEPTGNLDSSTARQMLDLFDQVNADGTTIVMVTHDSELAARARRKVHILDGRVIDPWAPALPWGADLRVSGVREP